MNIRKVLEMILIILMFVLSLLLSVNDFIEYSLIINIMASLTSIFWVKKIDNNYVSVSVFFISFGMIYGLYGPINVVWGEGIPSIFYAQEQVKEFLFVYAISIIGLIFGIFSYNFFSNRCRYKNKQNYELLSLFTKRTRILNYSIYLIFLSSTFELINFARIGGISVLFSGKARYQSLVSELTFTLPSDLIMIIAFSLFSVYLGINLKMTKKLSTINMGRVGLFFLFSIPIILNNIILGKIGELLSVILCFIVGISYFKPIKKLKFKLVIIVAISYILLSFIYQNRAIAPLILEDPPSFFNTAFTKDSIVKTLTPGAGEFTAAYGNFSVFDYHYGTNFTPRLGTTYVKGLVLPIPSFLYPGDKPQQITYEFRDEFFISEARRGSIAGTGFSSILEAYINFKHIGVFFIYVFIGYILQKIENVYRYRSITSVLVYIATFSQTRFFHRSAFGSVFSNVFYIIIFIYIISLMLNLRANLKR